MAKKNDPTEEKRKYVSQADIPLYSLEDSLKIASAIVDNYAGKPTAPFQVATAMDLSPGSSNWRKLTGASIAYELTDGGYNSDKIGLTDLARKILTPTEEGLEKTAKVDAALKPKVLKLFFNKYNNAKFPKDNIAENVLKLEMGVPQEDVARVLTIIKENGAFTGIIHLTKTGPYIFIENPQEGDSDNHEEKESKKEDDDLPEDLTKKLSIEKPLVIPKVVPASNQTLRVFISHGKNQKIVDQVKELLKFGQFDPVVAVDKESTAIPVPEKVFSEMRTCQAGVIHVEGEEELLDKDGNVHYKLNENVLIEIGAAIALFDKKFILLCEKSIKLPSNLQGLYRCNYEGKQLDYEATMKLLKTFNEIRQK
ncbi:MAG: hypothetical protein C0490_09130 [Marivirga sp.]|nr:hypothetical protein [Marivirga sp.]